MGPKQSLSFWVRVDLRLIAMQRYSTVPKSPELDTHLQMQFGFARSEGDTASIFYAPLKGWYSSILFNGISTFLAYLLPKILLQNCIYCLNYSWDNQKVHAFPNSIFAKMNAIVRLGFELSVYDVAVAHGNQYATGTTSSMFWIISVLFGLVLWHINHWRLCNVISFFTYILNI